MAIEGMPLKGKVALITGGTRGIGGAISRKLASWGCTVCLNYVDRHAAAKKIAAELADSGAQVSLHCADISIAGEIERLMDEVNALHGNLNILVCNAAANKFAPVENVSLGYWAFVQDTNARSTWLLAKHAFPLMEGREGARLITITNTSPHRIIQTSGPFAAAKAKLEILTSYLAYEFAPAGIVANCVRPGLVRTSVFNLRPDFETAFASEQERSPWGNGRVTTLEDCGDAVAMLCLDEAAWISGQLITLDGGYKWWCQLREVEEM
jgi:NAD(P)-dependent dehydrogenase (short-subunit alcohol dehydrogenase family)